MKDHKKKGAFKRIHPLEIIIYVTNYFFSASWWIANLGVLPCWRFLALRRAPMFLWRRARFVSVTLVLETISLLRLLQRLSLTKRSQFLPSPAYPVKRFVTLAAFIPFFLASAYGQSQSLFIAIGEHSELSVPQLKEYSVSNNDTLSHKFRPNTKTLLIRGKRQGHVEVVVWNKAAPKSVWNIYVLSKAKHLKWMETLKALGDLGLSATATGRLVRIEGIIKNRNEWSAFRALAGELEKQTDLTFINNVSPAPELSSELLGSVYESFLFLHADDVDCQKLKTGPWIKCLISHSSQARAEVKSLIKELLKTEFLVIETAIEAGKLTNYRLKVDLFKLEQANAIETDMSVESAAGTLSMLNRKDLINLAKNDDFKLGETLFKLTQVAKPELVIRDDKDFEIQMGSEIPYQSTDANQNSSTSFKFAGLKITGVLTQTPLGKVIDYQIELTAPSSEGAIAGNKKMSSIMLRLGEETRAFTLNLSSKGIDQKSLPYINKIPILGALFSDLQQTSSEKVIIGTFTLEHTP